MIEIKGRHNQAIVFVDALEPTAEAQIRAVCDQPHFADSKIRVMPDVHAGKGCTIGTTMTLHGKAVPSMVGVDIGCGMETVKLKEREIDFDALDKAIRAHVPSGRAVREQAHPYNDRIDLNALRAKGEINLDRARMSIGTLGGGNHFIEVDRDEDGDLYLVIHSGSRHLGTEIAGWYQREGLRVLSAEPQGKARGKGKKKKAAQDAEPIPRDLAYVEGALFDDYLSDMKLTQAFAALNRKAMADVILSEMNLHATDGFTTIHNYIDTESMILRKGAVSARKGERLLIPINMRDGSLLCVGLGNDDWNQSAPHGAGRLMSRSEANRRLSLQQFQDEMRGVYSTSVSKGTLDESPMAYKSLGDTIAHIGPTARIEKMIKPVYNFKASQ